MALKINAMSKIKEDIAGEPAADRANSVIDNSDFSAPKLIATAPILDST
jgi:hypothetical protein